MDAEEFYKLIDSQKAMLGALFRYWFQHDYKQHEVSSDDIKKAIADKEIVQEFCDLELGYKLGLDWEHYFDVDSVQEKIQEAVDYLAV